MTSRLYDDDVDEEYRNTLLMSTVLPPVDEQRFDDGTFLAASEFSAQPPSVAADCASLSASVRGATSLHALFDRVAFRATPIVSSRDELLLDVGGEIAHERVVELRELRVRSSRAL